MSLRSDYIKLESGLGEEDVLNRQKVVRTLVGEGVRGKAHQDGVPAKWCEEKVEEFHFEAECVARSEYLGHTKWKVAPLEVAESDVARSMAEEEEERAAPKVRLLEMEKVGENRRRVGERTENEEVVQKIRELIAPLGHRTICGGLLRTVGKESVFADAHLSLVAGGGPTPAGVGVSQQADAWRQR